MGIVVAFLCVTVSAAELPAVAGHWKGQLDLGGRIPGGSAWQWHTVDLHLDVGPAGNWIGSVWVGSATRYEIPLDDIGVDGRTVRFFARLPAQTKFIFVVGADGLTMNGQANFRGNATISLRRMGDPEVKVPPDGPVPAEFVGTWDGILEVNGRKFRRVTLKLVRRDDGTATGTIDWGNEEAPIFCVTVVDGELYFETRVTGGVYRVKLQPDGTLSGTWKEKSDTISLSLKRV